MKRYCKYLILLLLALTFSCNEKPSKPAGSVSKSDMKSSMETAHRYMLNEEAEDIENYVRRHGLELNKNGAGLS